MEIEELKKENEHLKAQNFIYYNEREYNNKVQEKLHEQIEKMKCCGNCIHRHYWGNELGCNLEFDKQFECDNNNKKYWEFSEV